VEHEPRDQLPADDRMKFVAIVRIGIMMIPARRAVDELLHGSVPIA
jgi:hypothetical protein